MTSSMNGRQEEEREKKLAVSCAQLGGKQWLVG